MEKKTAWITRHSKPKFWETPNNLNMLGVKHAQDFQSRSHSRRWRSASHKLTLHTHMFSNVDQLHGLQVLPTSLEQITLKNIRRWRSAPHKLTLQTHMFTNVEQLHCLYVLIWNNWFMLSTFRRLSAADFKFSVAPQLKLQWTDLGWSCLLWNWSAWAII